jgi:hypothetical protein
MAGRRLTRLRRGNLLKILPATLKRIRQEANEVAA